MFRVLKVWEGEDSNLLPTDHESAPYPWHHLRKNQMGLIGGCFHSQAFLQAFVD
jgi:hypothetical protein